MTDSNQAAILPADLLLYQVDDRPPLGRLLIYGLQWLVLFLPLITVSTVMAAELLGMSLPARVAFFQRVMIVSGVVMIIQTLWGHRYPLMDGPSTVILLCFGTLSTHGLAALEGGMLAGGGLLAVCGFFGWIRKLNHLFTDNVIGVILLLIAFTLLPFMVPVLTGQTPQTPQGDPVIFGLSVTVIFGTAVFSYWLKGFWASLSLLWGIIFGCLIFGLLGRLDLSKFLATAWFSSPDPFWGPRPVFSLPVIASFLLAYLALVVNQLGSLYAIGQVVGNGDMERRIDRGMAGCGVGSILAGLLGVTGTVSYSLSPGIVLMTRVGTRYALTVCGVMFIILAFTQKLTAVLAIIPAPVVGAVLVTGLAAQMGAGISIFARSGRAFTPRDYMVTGIPVILGTLVSIFSKEFLTKIPAYLSPIMGNGLILGIIFVLLLEHVFMRRR
ncbi:MAG: purine/pyrimidine permease [Deltaproteobacteria bacterium]|nr:purine/pyrimidine permease [Deltaproteobacteria bacterium]